MGGIMEITILLGSNRDKGKHKDLMDNLFSLDHSLRFIELSKLDIKSCVACEECTLDGSCTLPAEDDFFSVLSMIKKSAALLIVTPIYAPIPSKLVALLERILSISFFGGKIGGNSKPLFNKRVGVISYGANGVNSSRNIKIMIEQFFSDDYNFESLKYPFLDANIESNGKDLIEYTQAIIDSI
jgi:hypothetical protein